MFTEVVLASATDAVFGFLVDRIGQGLTEKARIWLGRDAQRMAFKLSFVRAYSAFVDTYPTRVDELFDETFLRGRAAPLLALCLTRDGEPAPTDLAAAWADQLGLQGEARRQYVAELTPVSAFFLQQLVNELRAREEFQPLFNSRALDTIAESSMQATRELEKLREDISEVLNQANERYRISIGSAQGVVIGDHNTITNIFQTFGEASTPVKEYIRIREFETLVNERTRDFVGRKFIFDAIDHLLQDAGFSSGYIIIRGEPGIGKTALMGKLVKDRGYVHHFNIASQNIRSSRDFLTNICAQLIVCYDLAYASILDKATRDSGFLVQLLNEAATKARALPLVILIDALDEAEDTDLSPSANRLYLPSSLPPGVFFIVTMREEEDLRLFVDRREDIYLSDDSPQNLEDVEQYIRTFLQTHHDQMMPRIVRWGVDEDEFVKVLTEKSEGNFMYLVHVLRDISGNKLTPANVAKVRNLPQGLRDYYQRHWRTMRAQDVERFERYYEPVVCMLAVARESVTPEQVAEWTGLTPPRVAEVIGTWREFLNEEAPREGEPLYRIYHASFRDFLKAEVGLTRYDNAIAQTALNKIQW